MTLKLGHRYRALRPPVNAVFPVDRSLIDRQLAEKARLIAEGKDVKSVRRGESKNTQEG
jgi:hypothetical protein